MTQGLSFSDDDLSCYLDGEASRELAKHIEAAQANDPALSQRIEEMRAATARFYSGLDAMLAHAPAMPDLPPPSSSRQPAWGMAITGALAGAAAAAAAVVMIARPAPEPGWRDVVASYQSLYVTETLVSVDQPVAVSTAKLQDLSQTLGFDLTNLPEVDGMTYKRSQQLGYKGRPLAQLTFLTDQGGPVALCIVHTGGTDSASINSEILEGMSAYSWTQDGYGILLIGPQGGSTLENAAEQFRAALS